MGVSTAGAGPPPACPYLHPPNLPLCPLFTCPARCPLICAPSLPMPLQVSTDYINERRSGVLDALSTQVIDGTMVKIYAW